MTKYDQMIEIHQLIADGFINLDKSKATRGVVQLVGDEGPTIIDGYWNVSKPKNGLYDLSEHLSVLGYHITPILQQPKVLSMKDKVLAFDGKQVTLRLKWIGCMPGQYEYTTAIGKLLITPLSDGDHTLNVNHANGKLSKVRTVAESNGDDIIIVVHDD